MQTLQFNPQSGRRPGSSPRSTAPDSNLRAGLLGLSNGSRAGAQSSIEGYAVANQHLAIHRICALLGVYCVLMCGLTLTQSIAMAQGPGMGGGPGAGAGGQPGMPAFSEPKFKDRVWEMGGPRLSGLHRGKMVLGIEIAGNQAISKHKILSHMQTRKDRTFDEKQLQADLHELHGTELFRRIEPKIVEYDEGVVVRLKVEERPIVTEVVFHGVTRLEKRMLENHAGIQVGDPANPFSVEMARQRLLDLYHEKGMNQAAVEVLEGNKAGDRRVFFEISEGPVERIWSIDFIGNEVFSDAILATKIESRSARGGITAYIGNVANRNKMEDDANLLTGYYRSLGYFDARVDYRISYYDDGDFLDLTFVIDEGRQYQVREISIVGNKYPPFTTELLLDSMKMKPGDAFNLGKMQRDRRTLRNEFYGREGFVFVDIQPQPVFLEEPGLLDLVYKINEGDQYRAGAINVHIDGDSSHTKHSVVTNLIGIRPGELIDLQELENSERRLKAVQLFETNPAMGEPPRIEVRPPDSMEDDYFRY